MLAEYGLDSPRPVCTSPDSVNQIGLDPAGVYFPWLCESDWTRPGRCALPLTLWVRLDSTRTMCASPDYVSQIGLDPGGVHFHWLCESDWTGLDPTQPDPTVLVRRPPQCAGLCTAAQTAVYLFSFRMYVQFHNTKIMSMYFSRWELV